MQTFKQPLTHEEEIYYLKKSNHGDIEARNILVESNLRLVAHIVKKYNNYERDMEDLISIGTIGLIKAINTYDISKGNRLGTYASRCIENEILMFLRRERKTAKDVSLYEPIGTDKEGNEISRLDVLDAPTESALTQFIFNHNVALLYEQMPKVLSSQEYDVIIMRYGLYGKHPLTQREVAKKLSISRSYVSRIEKKALLKLKEVLE